MKIFTRIIHWGLLASIVVYVISGFGITQARIVEPMTFGLLGKNLAFKIHDYVFFPFVILLILHLYITFRKKRIR